jgi:hypothetical protein
VRLESPKGSFPSVQNPTVEPGFEKPGCCNFRWIGRTSRGAHKDPEHSLHGGHGRTQGAQHFDSWDKGLGIPKIGGKT